MRYTASHILHLTTSEVFSRNSVDLCSGVSSLNFRLLAIVTGFCGFPHSPVDCQDSTMKWATITLQVLTKSPLKQH